MKTLEKLGCLWVGHGTRYPAGIAEFWHLINMLEFPKHFITQACFLELAEPTIEQGLQKLADQGVQNIITAPLLLFTAGHAKHDIPHEVARVAQQLSLNIIGQSQALEMHESLLELSQQRIENTITHKIPRTTFLLVGRGSSDLDAIHHVQNYSKLLSSRMNLEGHTAFVTAAEPRLTDKLESLARLQLPSVVVLPHLLFAGEVLETIAQAVENIRLRHPQTQWHLAHHLGPHANVANALLQRVSQLVPDYFNSPI